MRWSPERVERLTQLWLEGLSASQIAEKLGDGITRNAVIGKAHRLNLKRKGEQVLVRPEPKPRKLEEPVVHQISMKNLEKWMCRWPSDVPGRYGLHVCGKTVQPGRQYCAEHCTQEYLMKRRSTVAA